MENNHRVMIAACDTFRSGAVEQLRTHTCRLKALHPKGEKEPEKVMLYDKGYGKDAAAVSMEAINLGKFYTFTSPRENGIFCSQFLLFKNWGCVVT